MLIDADNINWEDFFYGGPFEEIKNEENKVWIIAIEQDPFSNMISSEIVFEVDGKKRNDLLAVDSYISYRRTNMNDDSKCNPEGIVTKYTFLHKIIDHKDNLILIADADEYRFGGSEEIEDWESEDDE